MPELNFQVTSLNIRTMPIGNNFKLQIVSVTVLATEEKEREKLREKYFRYMMVVQR